MRTKKLLKKSTVLQILLLFWMIPLLTSCSIGTVRPFLKNPEFQSESLPIRTLRILAMTDETYTQPQIAKLISECSQLLEQQVGIRLEIIDWKSIKFNSKFPRDQIIKKVANESLNDKDSFDIVIAFTGLNLWPDGIILALTGTTWLGLIDDTYRRYIVVKLLDPYILLHELFHAFLFSKAHSKCIMATGLYPIGRNCLWLGIDDRNEVLKNKQRDFNIKPGPKGGSDFIEEPDDSFNSESAAVQYTN